MFLLFASFVASRAKIGVSFAPSDFQSQPFERKKEPLKLFGRSLVNTYTDDASLKA